VKNPRAPNHLRKETRKWWTKIVTDFELESHHLRVLQTCCESWDRMTAAREVIDREGMTFVDRLKAVRPRPEINIERDSRVAFLRALRELGLDIAGDAPRPPTIQSKR